MKNNNIKQFSNICAFLFICALPFMANAQYNDINYFARRTPMSYKMNPAIMPNAKFYLNLPFISGFNMSFATSGFHYNDLITRRSDDSLVMSLNNFYNKLGDRNSFDLENNLELGGLGFQVGNGAYLSFDVDLTVDGNVAFSKDMIGLIMNGVNTSDKSRAILSDKIFALNAYISPSISFSKTFGDKWSGGVRLKFPIGLANVSTEKSKLSLNYEGDNITAVSDFLIHTSIIAGSLKISSMQDNIEFEKTSGTSNIISGAMKNKGLAVDLGVTYKPTQKSMVSFSIQDLGSITWKTNSTDIVSKNPGGSYTFTGLGIMDFVDKDSTSVGDRLDEIKDSIINMLDLKTQQVASYKRALPTKLYFGYTYNFASHHFVNALYKITIGDGYTNHRWSAFWAMELGKYLNVSLGNTFAYYSASSTFSAWNPSALINLSGGGFNLYAGGGFNSSMNVAKTSGFSAYAGMNFVFGYKNYWSNESPKETPAQGTTLEKKTVETPSVVPTAQPIKDTMPIFTDTISTKNTISTDTVVKYDWDTVNFEEDTLNTNTQQQTQPNVTTPQENIEPKEQNTAVPSEKQNSLPSATISEEKKDLEDQ